VDEEVDDEAREWMARRRTAYTERMLELLADGEWHDREWLVDQVFHMVPPGVAYRKVENERISNLKVRKRKELSPEEYAKWESNPDNLERDPHRGHRSRNAKIMGGQRRVIMDRLQSSQRFERRTNPETGATEVRRVPVHPRFAESKAAKERRLAAAEGREPRKFAVLGRRERLAQMRAYREAQKSAGNTEQ
jgi:hypothetical protein